MSASADRALSIPERRSLDMKTHVLLAALAALVTCTGCDKLTGKKEGGSSGGILSFLAGDFEGEITMNAKNRQKGGPTTLVFGIKKPKYRIDASGGQVGNDPMTAQGAALILDPPNKKGYALMPAQKKAMVLDFENLKGQNSPFSGGGTLGTPSGNAKRNPPKIEKTGKNEVIAGYECEIWKITQDDGRKAEICAAEGITWIDLGDMGWSSPEIVVAASLSGANRFPLRIVSWDAKGVEEVRLETTKIDKKKLADTQFEVPPDYQVIDIGAMLQGLPQMPPGGGAPPTNLPPNFKLPQPPKR
jgi:hypothetical protein